MTFDEKATNELAKLSQGFFWEIAVRALVFAILSISEQINGLNRK